MVPTRQPSLPDAFARSNRVADSVTKLHRHLRGGAETGTRRPVVASWSWHDIALVCSSVKVARCVAYSPSRWVDRV